MSSQPLTFSLKTQTRAVIDCTPLTPNALAEKSLADIATTQLWCGTTPTRVDNLFDISGNDTQHIIIQNATPHLAKLGAEMTHGTLEIHGTAGDFLAEKLQGGKIICHGNTGDYAACQMKNGVLEIKGNAGDFLGAAESGLRKGMSGGVVVVRGNAGNRTADQMRRGLIIIEGNAGDYTASRMVAGTVAINGTLGANTGYLLRRGTLLLKHAPTLLPTWQNCGMHSLPFLAILLKSIAAHTACFNPAMGNRVQRIGGDLTQLGTGEMLIIQ